MLQSILSTITLFAAVAAADHHATLELQGATVDVTVQQPVSAAKAAQLIEWVRVNATHIEDVYGRFPTSKAKVILVTESSRGWGGDKAVHFGQVTRSNGGTVTLYIDANRPLSDFYADWTATHEFSHLMMPLLDKRYRWITEGLATYYQNVLMARGGQYSDEYAWMQLSSGFDRGRDSLPHVSPNEATANGIRKARMKIYWSGAAIALLADVELRRRSGGSESLDTVMDQLQACCLPARRRWSGPKLMRRLDSFLDEPLFVPLYNQYADKEGFPDVSSTLQRLGVADRANDLEFSDTADLAHIRDAIMTGTGVRR